MKIVIVCNGWNAISNINGNFINSCDIVIRLNRFRIEGFEQFIGNKIDVISLMLTGYGATCGILGHHPLTTYVHKAKSLWIPDKFRQEHHDNRQMALQQFNIRLNYNFSFVDEEVYDKLMLKMQDVSLHLRDPREHYFPDSGMTTIEKCVHLYPQESIYVTGFDPGNTKPYRYYWSKDDEPDGLNQHPQKAQNFIYQQYLRSGKVIEI